MPKIVDPDKKRSAIARAACRVIAHKGISYITMADIATEVGATTGMVLNYFSGKDEIIEAALRVPFENVHRRIDDGIRRGVPDLAEILDCTIPTTRKNFEDVTVWVNFWGMVATDTEYRKLNGRLHDEGLAVYGQAILHCWPESRSWSKDQFDTARRSIVSFLFGLSAGGVTNPKTWTASVQRDLLRQHLSGLRFLMAGYLQTPAVETTD